MGRAVGEAVLGAVEIAGGIALEIFVPGIGQVIGTALIGAGISTEAGAIAQALGSNQGLGVTTRTPAGLRQIIRGEQRVGGTTVYVSSTGSTKRQYNMVIALATHACEAIENLYLDGRQVFWDTSSDYNQTVNGVNFGGNAAGNNYTGPNGVQYNFGGLVFCAAFCGKQNSNPTVVSGAWVGPRTWNDGDAPYPGFCSALQANDGTWSPGTIVLGQTATATASFNGLGGGEIDSINLDDAGANYPNGPVGVSIIDAGGGPGTGASATANAVGGSIDPTSLVVTAAGTNYTDPQITFDPPATEASTPYLAGCTYVYLKVEADAGMFPSFPEIRFTVRGKNDIFDPRSSTRGYSTNWALQIADAITDATWGLGDNSVNQAQLIAAANVCDELTPCAGGEEAQFSLHWHCDTSTSPGDAIQQMMSAAMGRLSRIGGEWFIWPAYWPGPSFNFDENALLDAIQWDAKRPVADLCNRVTGTYIAANYPYNVAGNLYDSNGFYMGETQNNFPYGFQPTSYPQYAADPLHGYSEDAYLIADTPNLGAYSSANTYAAGQVVLYGTPTAPWIANEAVPSSKPPGSLDGSGNPYWSATGVYLPRELPQPCVLSISQAQRLAKIYMLRNRQQGSGTMVMSLAAFQMQPLDVMEFTSPTFGWTDKLFEISAENDWCMKLMLGKGVGANKGGDEDTPALYMQARVCETDPSVYEWDDAGEELTPYDVPAFSGAVASYIVASPTGLTATGSLAAALVAPDGTVTPRIELQWTEPADTYVANGGTIEIQMAAAGSGLWQDVLIVGGQTTVAFLAGVKSGLSYDVQIRGVRPNGASSAWVQALGIGIGFAVSNSVLSPVAPEGELIGVALSSSSGEIIVNPFTAVAAGNSVSCLSGGAVDITGLAPNTLYYVYYVDPAFAGGAITPVATQNVNDFLFKAGYWLIGQVVIPPWLSSGVPIYLPDRISNIGPVSVTGEPPAPVQVTSLNNGTAYFGEGIFSGWPGISITSPIEGGTVEATVAVVASSGTEWLVTVANQAGGFGAKPAGAIGTLNPRGAWAASTGYAQWDTFTTTIGTVGHTFTQTWLVIKAYTSAPAPGIGGTLPSADDPNVCLILASGSGNLSATSYATTQLPGPSGINSLTGLTLDVTINAPSSTGHAVITISNVQAIQSALFV